MYVIRSSIGHYWTGTTWTPYVSNARAYTEDEELPHQLSHCLAEEGIVELDGDRYYAKVRYATDSRSAIPLAHVMRRRGTR